MSNDSIDMIVNELVNEQQQSTDNKSTEPETKSTEETRKNVYTDSKPIGTREPVDVTQNEQLVNNAINSLFKNLFKTMIPTELQKNKDISTVFTSIFNVSKNKGKKENNKESEPVEESSEVEDEESESSEVDDEEDSDVEDETNGEDDVSGEDETSESEDNSEVDDEESDVDEETRDNSSDLFIILQNGEPLYYTYYLTDAKRALKELHKQFIRSNPNSFLSTKHEFCKKFVYERNAFSLFPFQDRLVCTLSIISIPEY